MRAWIAVALLSGSWLLGLGYHYPPSPLAWIAMLAAAVILLGCPHPNPLPEGEGTGSGPHPNISEGEGTYHGLLAVGLLVPVVWFAPWPYRAAPLLLAGGLAIGLLRVPQGLIRRLGRGSVWAGVVLFAQAIAMTAYAALTARSHDLPWPLPDLLAGIAGVLRIDAVADGPAVVMRSMRRVHRLAATWELLLDPATVCFTVGCVAILAAAAAARVPLARRRGSLLAAFRTLAVVLLAWLPLRAALMIAFYLQRVLRTESAAPLHAMNHFFSPWVLLLLLIAPVLLVWRFVRWPAADEAADAQSETAPSAQEVVPRGGPPPVAKSAGWHPAAVAGLALLATAIFAAALQWDPIGSRKAGRVMVVERHSTWEPTMRPYDTAWYGEPSGYNYAVMYDYLGQFYQMSRLLEADKIDDEMLGRCDVLIIKTPTARYTPDEAAAVQRFVRQGGGLLLIGDHTNFEGLATIMNDVIGPMGFIYRPDLLFGMGESPYDELYTAPTVPHPVVQHLPPMDFAVSCSIDPGRTCGGAAILGSGLWSMPPEYHHDNYHPVPEHCPEMRYGAFLQLWAAHYGKGRVLPFTDSTIFSNFCVFQPGKAELLLGMVEWLNHAAATDFRPWLLLLGVLPVGGTLWLARGRRGTWLMLLGGGACGWVLASVALAAAQRQSMPTPTPLRPGVQVIIDRTVSEAPLSKGPYPQGDEKGYGMLEQWLPRLGYFTTRRSGAEALRGDALVVICPSRPVDAEFRQRLVRYVAEGGKLLVVDAAENTTSTANSLLWPFGLSLDHGHLWQGTLMMADQWPGLRIERACEVSGGQSVARLGQDRCAAAIVEHGKGRVMAIGCGSVWNDINMGETWMLEPNEETRTRYDALYAAVRLLVEGKPITAPPPPAMPEPKERPLEELGISP